MRLIALEFPQIIQHVLGMNPPEFQRFPALEAAFMDDFCFGDVKDISDSPAEISVFKIHEIKGIKIPFFSHHQESA